MMLFTNFCRHTSSAFQHTGQEAQGHPQVNMPHIDFSGVRPQTLPPPPASMLHVLGNFDSFARRYVAGSATPGVRPTAFTSPGISHCWVSCPSSPNPHQLINIEVAVSPWQDPQLPSHHQDFSYPEHTAQVLSVQQPGICHTHLQQVQIKQQSVQCLQA